MKPPVKTLALLLCLLSLPALAAPGVMLRDEDLKASAGAGAANVGRVARGASVEVLARQGGWTQVRGNGRTGWVRILSVRASAPSSSAADLAGLVDAGTTRRDPGKVVAVAGLRGLTEDELKTARFNAGELARLHQYAATRAEAEQFARSASLRRQDVRYLAKPAEAGEAGSGGSWPGVSW